MSTLPYSCFDVKCSCFQSRHILKHFEWALCFKLLWFLVDRLSGCVAGIQTRWFTHRAVKVSPAAFFICELYVYMSVFVPLRLVCRACTRNPERATGTWWTPCGRSCGLRACGGRSGAWTCWRSARGPPTLSTSAATRRSSFHSVALFTPELTAT